MGAGSNLFSYSQAQKAWTQRGTIPQLDIEETQIASSIFDITNPDMASQNNISVYAFEQNGVTYVKVIDELNKSVLLQQSITTEHGQVFSPKVLVAADNVTLVLGSDGHGDLNYWSINTLVPNLITGPNLLITSGLGLNSSKESMYDAVFVTGYLCVSGQNRTLGLDVWTFNANFTLNTHSVNPSGTAQAPTSVNCNVLQGQLAVSYSVLNTSTNTNIYCDIFSVPGLTSVVVSNLVDGPGSGCPRLSTVGFVRAGGYYLGIFYEVQGTGTELPSISYVVVNASGGIAGRAGAIANNLQIAGQPFGINGSSFLYFWGTNPSVVQPTLFLLQTPVTTTPSELNSEVIGKFFAWTAGVAPSNNRIPQANLLDTNSLVIMATTNATSSIDTGTSTTEVAIDSVSEISVSFDGQILSTQLGQNLHLASGGLLWDYDGQNVNEHNFNLFPESVITSFNTTQLSIISDVYDIHCNTAYGSQSAFRIAIPDNGASPGGSVGQLITPGEYISFNAVSEPTGTSGSNATPTFVYFVVNGVGSAPAGSTFSLYSATTYACNLTSGMNAIEVATAIYNTLISITDITAQYAISYTPNAQGSSWTNQFIDVQGLTQFNSVTGSSNFPVAISPPSLSRVCSATQVLSGLTTDGQGSGAVTGVISIQCIPASLISSGQYVVVNAPCPAATYPLGYTLLYIWFSNPNVQTYTGISNQSTSGTDPDPFGIGTNGVTSAPYHYSTLGGTSGNFIGIEVTLNGNETEAQVATAVTSALEAAISNFNLFMDVPLTVGSTTTCVASASSPGAPMPPVINTWTNNPNYVGMGQGYVGQNTTNTTGVAVLEYSGLYESVDNRNQLHQSNPSVPTTVYLPVYSVTGSLPGENAVLTFGTGKAQLIFTQNASSGYGTAIQNFSVQLIATGAQTLGLHSVIPIAGQTASALVASIQSSIAMGGVVPWVVTFGGDGSETPVGASPTFFGTSVAGGGVATGSGQMVAGSTAIIQSTPACSQVVNVNIDPLCLSQKTSVNIGLYRTITNNDNVAYLLTSPSNLLENDNQVELFSYIDYSPDIDNATLTNGVNQNQPLYTTGGVIADNAPPGFTYLINHQNRLFGVSAENDNLIYYSQGFSSGFEVMFNRLARRSSSIRV